MAAQISCEPAIAAKTDVTRTSDGLWAKVVGCWTNWRARREAYRRNLREVEVMLAMEDWMLQDIYGVGHGDIIAAKRSLLGNRHNPAWRLSRFLQDRIVSNQKEKQRWKGR
ncbi:hypothetical protein L6172_11885 [Thalassospiraceae bacterium SW-3-3]|nr:hypothetical protein L6172_11885 [Thalassospiraceae bacterium SW-3-3]